MCPASLSHLNLLKVLTVWYAAHNVLIFLSFSFLILFFFLQKTAFSELLQALNNIEDKTSASFVLFCPLQFGFHFKLSWQKTKRVLEMLTPASRRRTMLRYKQCTSLGALCCHYTNWVGVWESWTQITERQI